jgi:hypothetical protein
MVDAKSPLAFIDVPRGALGTRQDDRNGPLLRFFELEDLHLKLGERSPVLERLPLESLESRALPTSLRTVFHDSASA